MLMRQTQLILLEGISGSGKSATAHHLTRQLQRQGHNAIWFGEQDAEHPTNVASFETPEQFIHDTISNWQTFVADVQRQSCIVVLEASLFQSFVRVLFHRNATLQQIAETTSLLASLIAPLDPVFILLHQADVRTTLRCICAHRGQRWTRRFVESITSKPYAQHHNLSGFDGAVRYWEDYQALMEQLYAMFRMPKLAIANESGDWSDTMRRMYTFLELPTFPEPMLPISVLAPLVGVYRDEAAQHDLAVRLVGQQPYLEHFIWDTTRLLANTETLFEIEGWSYTLSFVKDDTGRLDHALLGGRDVEFIRLCGHMLQKIAP
jgi:hypothetical protein